eukprot:GHUV01034711.1.p1 GENE.GHUV01034711.1~~GHUV01034711.1.p1  ORF type:complete len:138 (-),score=54.77 GHUV01034711.1:555-938(-)
MGMPHAGRFSSSEVQDYAAAAAAAAAAFASGMHGGMGPMGEGMYEDGSADPRHMMGRYNSESYEDAVMGGTSSGGRSVSPGAGGRAWTRSARGDVSIQLLSWLTIQDMCHIKCCFFKPQFYQCQHAI